MKFHATILCAIALATSACTTPGASIDNSIQSTVTSTDQAVQAYLVGRDLNPIEGAWKHDENAFELIISRNNFDIASDYDYVGIITRTDQPFWKNGDVKLLLRSTESAGIFDGVWMTSNRARKEMTFVIERKNLIQGSYQSNNGNTYFVRIRRMNPRLAAAN